MRRTTAEILSDRSDAAVMRHSSHDFPGILVQGDGLGVLCRQADLVCTEFGRGAPGYDVLDRLRRALRSHFADDEVTLLEHELPLPVSEDAATARARLTSPRAGPRGGRRAPPPRGTQARAPGSR